jgi:DNA (cytosine-5)-methyltransferase 1
VPQQRQRVIFIGVRDDIGMNPIFPKPLPYRYTVRDAIPWIIKVQAKGSFNEGFRMKSAMNPSQTIIASNMRKVEALLPDKSTEHRKFTIAELKRICSFPDDFILKGNYGQQWERLGNSVPPIMMFHISSAIRDSLAGAEPLKETA